MVGWGVELECDEVYPPNTYLSQRKLQVSTLRLRGIGTESMLRLQVEHLQRPGY